jgi:two-component system OmpR family sensor kinase
LRTSSIRRRLVTAVVVTQLLLTIGLVIVAVFLTRRQLRSAFDAGLHGRAMSVAALVRYSEDAPTTLIFDREMIPPPFYREYPDYYRIVDGENKLIAASPNWPADFDPQPKHSREYWDLSIHGESYRAVRLQNVPVLDWEGAGPTTAATLTVFYAAPTRQLQQSVWRVGILIAICSIALLAIASVAVVRAIGRGLSPLATLASSAAAVSPANWVLHTPAESLHTSELAPLTQAMTAMLANLRQAFDSQRAFLADAAHELKTPVAILKSTLQSLLQRPRSSEEYRAGVEAALEDTVRLEKLVHSMLRLARAEQWAMGSARPDLAEIDLTSTCELSVERVRPLAQRRGVKLDFQRNGSAKLQADAEDLELVWGNLLENAIQYSPAESKVILTIHRSGPSAEVTVQDNGPGIPEAEIPLIFDRFHRGDSSRARNTGGYGLGLAISKAIIEAYGGTIAVRSGVGAGTTMIVTLPLNT